MGTFLKEVTVIDDKEACWNSLKKKEVQEGNSCPVSGNGGKRAKLGSNKQKSALLDCAEEFCQKLNIPKRNTKRGFRKDFASIVVRRVTT